MCDKIKLFNMEAELKIDTARFDGALDASIARAEKLISVLEKIQSLQHAYTPYRGFNYCPQCSRGLGGGGGHGSCGGNG